MSVLKEKAIKKDKEKDKKDDQLSQNMKSVLDEVMKLDISINFKNPVDTKLYPNYLQIIQTPMDLSKIKKTVKGQKYKSKKDFIEDLQLISTNCKKFNLEGSQIWNIAATFEKKVNKITKKYFTQKRKNKNEVPELVKEKSSTKKDNLNKDTTIILTNPGKKSGLKVLNNQGSKDSKQQQNSEKKKNKQLKEAQQQQLQQQQLKNEEQQQQEIKEEENNEKESAIKSQNPMNSLQKEQFMKCIDQGSEKILYEMVKVVDKHENYTIEIFNNQFGQQGYQIRLDSLDAKTIQKMIDAGQQKMKVEEGIEVEVKSEDQNSKTQESQQDSSNPMIIEKYQNY